MNVKDRTVLILGGWGLVGSAIARTLVPRQPRSLVIHSLRRGEAEEAVANLAGRYADAGLAFVPAWGNVFVRAELKDRSREDLLRDRETRRMIVADTMEELSDRIVRSSFLYQLLVEHRPEIVVDCINTATAFAYQDVFYSVRRVQKSVAAIDAGLGDAEALRDAIENHLTTLPLPQLIRHVQVMRESLRDAGTRVYLKVGTTGTGGMGLNIPYTHSEERPSRMLLAKSSIAGAQSMLLYLLARTSQAPVVKEVKPGAAIAWKRIGVGPVMRQGMPIELYDFPPHRALDPSAAMQDQASGWQVLRGADGRPRVLESVYIDMGENGMFSGEEFETVSALGQMEFLTPEEIADIVLIELEGGTTGREIVSALDGAILGPSYRAGAMRHRVIEEMQRLAGESGLDSVAFEMLGPPRLSKLLYEAHLLRRACGSLSALADGDPEVVSRACTRWILDDAELRARILSIGIPILLPEGRLLRGPEMKIPPYKEEARETLTAEAIERWAGSGWVDLRPLNFEVWRSRARAILAEIESHPWDDTSSARFEDRRYWRVDTDIPPGRVAAWILGVEDGGSREKAQ